MLQDQSGAPRSQRNIQLYASDSRRVALLSYVTGRRVVGYSITSSARASSVGGIVWRRPHPLANLRAAGQSTGETHIYVGIFVGLDPRRVLHLVLANHWPRFDRGVNLVARPIEETGVDEDYAIGRGADAFLQIDAGPPLLVHDADLQGVSRQAQHVFHAR